MVAVSVSEFPEWRYVRHKLADTQIPHDAGLSSANPLGDRTRDRCLRGSDCLSTMMGDRKINA